MIDPGIIIGSLSLATAIVAWLETRYRMTTLSTKVKTEATLAAAVVIADALVAAAKIKADALVVKV